MIINGYGVSYNYNNYGTSANKDKTSSAFAVALDEKIKTESKKNNNANQVYDPFKDMATTGSVSLPSWIYTKTEPTRSDEEILKDMIELAKKHAKQGTFQYDDDEFQSLTKEWVSSASPDRESILENTVKEINEKKYSINKKNVEIEEKDFDMIDVLMQALKIEKKDGNKIGSSGNEKMVNADGSMVLNMNGDTYDACVEDGNVKFAQIRDDNGKNVLLFDSVNSSGQLSIKQCWTDEEGLRRGELMKVYAETYKSVSDSKGLVSGNAFDAVG